MFTIQFNIKDGRFNNLIIGGEISLKFFGPSSFCQYFLPTYINYIIIHFFLSPMQGEGYQNIKKKCKFLLNVSFCPIKELDK